MEKRKPQGIIDLHGAAARRITNDPKKSSIYFLLLCVLCWKYFEHRYTFLKYIIRETMQSGYIGIDAIAYVVLILHRIVASSEHAANCWTDTINCVGSATGKNIYLLVQ